MLLSPAMGRWWESAKSVFGDGRDGGEDGEDGGSVGCFPRIRRKRSRNTYACTADPGTLLVALSCCFFLGENFVVLVLCSF